MRQPWAYTHSLPSSLPKMAPRTIQPSQSKTLRAQHHRGQSETDWECTLSAYDSSRHKAIPSHKHLSKKCNFLSPDQHRAPFMLNFSFLAFSHLSLNKYLVRESRGLIRHPILRAWRE